MGPTPTGSSTQNVDPFVNWLFTPNLGRGVVMVFSATRLNEKRLLPTTELDNILNQSQPKSSPFTALKSPKLSLDVRRKSLLSTTHFFWIPAPLSSTSIRTTICLRQLVFSVSDIALSFCGARGARSTAVTAEGVFEDEGFASQFVISGVGTPNQNVRLLAASGIQGILFER